MKSPYLNSTLAEVQEHLRSGGFAHENALSLAVKLPSRPLFQVAAKAKLNNQGQAVPDVLTFTHALGNLTVKEEIRSSSDLQVTVAYQLSSTSSLHLDADLATKAFKLGFSLAAALAKAEVTVGSDKVLQATAVLGNEKLGANFEGKIHSAAADYSLSFYAKRPNFDLILRCTGHQTSLQAVYFSYYQRLSSFWDIFGLIEVDRVANKRNLDVTCTYNYDQMNSLKAKLVTDGTFCCSVVHSLGAKTGISYGLQTNLWSLASSKAPEVQYGVKIKLAG